MIAMSNCGASDEEDTQGPPHTISDAFKNYGATIKKSRLMEWHVRAAKSSRFPAVYYLADIYCSRVCVDGQSTGTSTANTKRHKEMIRRGVPHFFYSIFKLNMWTSCICCVALLMCVLLKLGIIFCFRGGWGGWGAQCLLLWQSNQMSVRSSSKILVLLTEDNYGFEAF